MPMPNRLLPPRVDRDALDRQVDFYEAFGVWGGHFCFDFSALSSMPETVPMI